MPRIKIRFEGLSEMAKRCNGDVNTNAIFSVPWRQAFQDAVTLVYSRVSSRAPQLSGTLFASVTSKLDARPFPTWGLVTAGAENKGVRYPFVLQAGKGKGGSVTHYASTKRKTRGWFGSFPRKAVQKLLDKAAGEIERRWASG